MGRPTASKENKEFGVFFANFVTVPVEAKSTTVARSGEGSVFFVFAQCFPELIRTNSRTGLTQLEFNKFLQTNEFPTIRKRGSYVPPREHLPFFPPSSFRFAGRRWRNPDNTEDLAYLRSGWPIIAKGLNAVSFEEFCNAVTDAIALGEKASEAAELLSTEEADWSSDCLSNCSTPCSNKRAKVDEHDRPQHFGLDTDAAQDLLLDLPLVDDHEVSSCQLDFADSAPQVGLKRRRSSKWIDAQTFLDEFQAGRDYPELWAFVNAPFHEHAAISCHV